MIAIFDFDKTVVQIDSFRLFARIAAGSFPRRLRCLGLAVLCKLGFLSNTRYKETILAAYWFSPAESSRQERLNSLMERLHKAQHPLVVERLRQHARAGDTVLVMSASPEFYLLPFVHSVCPEARVAGSRVTLDGSVARLDNLQGDQKARRAREVIEEAGAEEVVVYTDHLVDLPLVRLAGRAVLVRPSRRLLRAVRRLGIDCEVIP